ncbi:MAG: type II secretion system protein [Pseudomonadota bacterium]
MLRKLRKQSGFTLVELLIVVIILAILAAIVVPQFGSTTADANNAAYESNLAALQSVVELYRQQHNGVYPGAVQSGGGSCSTGSAVSGNVNTQEAFIAQLSNFTNVQGQACTGFSANNHRFGPYLKEGVPNNPLGNSNQVVVVNTGILGLSSGGTGGWRYDVITGELIGDQ